MKTYLVGGSVRDEILGLPVTDHDYVVVGVSPEEMVHLGFRPVGKDFPVFLHPQSQEQYALARTERKVSRGYKGFEVYASPEVTLQEDLARRDLTINAIAKDEYGNIIDPFGGIADLEAGVLRHIGPAFTEDPVRVLRTARFAARFGFHIAPETLALMNEMVHNGEVDALVSERVWQEIARGLMERHPSRMFYALRDCGALTRIMPEVDALFGVPQPPQHHPEIDTGVHVMMVIDYAASRNYSLQVRFAALTHDLGKGTTPPEEWPRHIGHEARSVRLVQGLCERINPPNEMRNLALLVARYHGDVHRAAELRPVTIANLLQGVDAYRKPERFEEFLQACACDFHGRPGYATRPYPQADRLREAFQAARSVDAGAIAKEMARNVSDPSRLPVAINTRVSETRIAEIRNRLGSLA
ncbi:metal dependent phosphohydrolase [Nitrosospira multiformis ATCC 25196]|uniref:Multifunctional CCA protein n=2 Tax=Nitrosospira multiformis (strain ATCC 25196 / NCIMB 11849 / C 71) TaxID=323848 RepID=CCA_NITMU|nr:multifunctional CCA addition/repair protein [Nitrosospira multiformis]Q2Y681.1 RecName: Full=Multifunctional CCA protein; Includes: RecName: Full=CCA-adding enzyme; AltName: Full=CCA tRNA nucleotidyltransferase; AltName: Full=tRNA CCA-pyrophosphorylase; AltName: Full=tRNA adenylyl-/cytidylyl-transferase; AltName: Full=tRNA nucleotidyltransferase; AltName: Full=tRNA-NT; Includes: RecName: Full=2'-nucleotidase; Includes: RecName: Full=2',3'-cyclic phosphodiesterase; Includes: RecName: Full=Phosph